jgi:phage protein D
VISFRFEDDEQKTDKLTLTVDNYDLSALEGDLWVPETILEFQFGYPGAMSPPREAVIQKVSGFNPMTVEADSKDCLMNRIQRTDRSWENVKRSDVVREIVKGYGYDDDKLHIVDTKVIVDHVTQGRMTDLQLIKSLAAREGFEFFVDFDGVHFHRRSTKDKPIKTLVYFADPGAGDILSISLEVDKRGKQAASAVVLQGKDPKTGEPFKVRADASTTASERAGLADNLANAGTEAKTIEAIDGVTGESTLVTSAEAKQAAQELVGPTSETTQAAAQRQADGAFLKHQLRGAHLTITIVLDALVFAKAVVKLERAGMKLSGNWYVKNAIHDVIAGTTTIKVGREGLNGQGVPTPAAKVNKLDGPSADGGGAADGPNRLEPRDNVDAFGNVTTDYVPAPRGDGT